jgi:F-type H+-transporting ATPase subunit alpha
MELLKQPQYSPWPLDHEVLLVYAGTRGYLDNVAVKQVARWRQEFLRYMDTSHSQVGKIIRETGAWNDDIENSIKQGIMDFNATWSNEESVSGNR